MPSGTSTEPEQCMTPGVIRTTARLIKIKETLNILDNFLGNFNSEILLHKYLLIINYFFVRSLLISSVVSISVEVVPMPPSH